ncbi:SLATT domain-containing protein [Pseudomonas sp. zfem004]|uniref:SLATT domain-containing protein n=1 Tax=Pseudomonas sp. zfem004 TaxID=3078199 RepID=UPI002927E2D9|nr:SLATT domain-containing protein [Pseudomonas sp. zfem004]MDU9402922.1 SLATT domain-containing protein [Pseudomonas sp. zfem004]
MFADNIWWTRKARIQAEKRLLSNAFQAQLLLIWYSFLSAAVSIYYLKATASSFANVSWVAFSVLILSISGFINGLSYKERANLIKECYENLQDIYTQAKKQGADIEKIGTRYQEILKICENHEDIDFNIALCDTYLSHPEQLRKDLTKSPTSYIWAKVAFYYIKRSIALMILYILPIGMFIAMEAVVTQ